MAITNADYIKQYANIHKNKTFGVTGFEFVNHIQACIAELKPKAILDYGCGQTDMSQRLNLLGGTFNRYDPAISAISTLPVDSADLLINTDVLEHIPKQDLGGILQHMASISNNAFFNIATRLAREILPNGENAHCTILTADEWLLELRQHFPNVMLVVEKKGYSCMFVTWESSLKDVFVVLDAHKSLAKKVEKYERTLSDRLGREFARFKKKVLKQKS